MNKIKIAAKKFDLNFNNLISRIKTLYRKNKIIKKLKSLQVTILNEILIFELNKFIGFQLKYATLKKQIF